MKQTFTVTISAPEGILFTGEAMQLDASNSEGPFSIWADHARFLTILAPEPVRIELAQGETKEFNFTNAVLFFKDDSAKIYTQPNMA